MRNKGFTLIEMLIVIVIITALIGIALPRLRSMQSEGDYAKARGESRTLQVAVESFYVHHTRQYPNPSTSVTTSWQASLTGATPQILAGVLDDPFKPGTQYGYATDTASATTAKYYVVFSVGPDGAADITGINDSGVIQGGPDDDIWVSNGTQPSGG